jgi:hypothetical protein
VKSSAAWGQASATAIAASFVVGKRIAAQLRSASRKSTATQLMPKTIISAHGQISCPFPPAAHRQPALLGSIMFISVAAVEILLKRCLKICAMNALPRRSFVRGMSVMKSKVSEAS